MKNITTKQFNILTDINLVWDFFVEIYDEKRGGGVAAPFFEYAIQSSWMVSGTDLIMESKEGRLKIGSVKISLLSGLRRKPTRALSDQS